MPAPAVSPSILAVLALALVLGCGGGSATRGPAPLSGANTNLVFVVSPDLAYQTAGDVQPDTANLSSQGLQRSLRMAPYLEQRVLGGNPVSGIYALAPMTHLQTAGGYPDMAAIGFIQPFALQSRITLPLAAGPYTANSYPIRVSYASGSVPSGVATPTPPYPGGPAYSPDTTGLDFSNANGNNDTLVDGIIARATPGCHVFSAPWETVQALLAGLKANHGYPFSVPASFQGSNIVYAVSISASGGASLVTYDSELDPPSSYPVLPSPVPVTTRSNVNQPYFHAVLTGGLDGVVVPPGANTNARVYIVRHAEAHPDPDHAFDDGNYVAAGQWRALALATTLAGRISPNLVCSIDPAALWYSGGSLDVSYIRPSLTILPYVVANNLPYRLAADLPLGSPYEPTDPTVARATSDYFFTGGAFSGQTVLVAWESGHIKPFLNALLASYGGTAPLQLATGWPAEDYDTIWSVLLDAQGNLTIDNSLIEGIDSARLPATAPSF
jgi:hypothetical protein